MTTPRVIQAVGTPKLSITTAASMVNTTPPMAPSRKMTPIALPRNPDEPARRHRPSTDGRSRVKHNPRRRVGDIKRDRNRAHASEIIDAPTVNTPPTRTGREPNRSMAHPIAGDSAIDSNAPALTAPQSAFATNQGPVTLGI